MRYSQRKRRETDMPSLSFRRHPLTLPCVSGSSDSDLFWIPYDYWGALRFSRLALRSIPGVVDVPNAVLVKKNQEKESE